MMNELYKLSDENGESSQQTDSSLKGESKNTRVRHGNEKGDAMTAYLNHRYDDANLQPMTNGNKLDTIDGIDCKNDDNFDAQNKWRQSGSDAIYAFQRFDPNAYKGRNPDLKSGWKISPDRDARSKSAFNIVGTSKLPHIILLPSWQMKKVLKNVLDEWGLSIKPVADHRNGVICNLIEVDDEQITKWYKSAYHRENKCIDIFTSKKYKNAIIQFKIDEGEEKPFAKLILYCPPSLCDAAYIELISGEAIQTTGSWKPSTGESFKDVWKNLPTNGDNHV